MQRIFEILYEGKGSSFTVTKIARSKFYGSKQRIPVDAQGHECSRASLTRDGRYILPAGGVAILYLDDQEDVVERNQLQTIDPDGDVMKPGESTPDTVLELAQVAEATNILECSIAHVYALEPIFISAGLEALLSQGTIYRLPECNGHQAFLLGNDVGYFLLVGILTGFEFVGLAEADLSPPELDIDEVGNELDFTML